MVNRRQLLKISALGTASFAAPLSYSASNITMAYNTGNAIGSTSPKDLSDNARNLDHLVNGTDASYLDRKGVPRKSWKGMESEHNADQSRRESEFDADQSRRDTEYAADKTERDTEFAADQAEREVDFNTWLDASGFENPPLTYVDGNPLQVARVTQLVARTGNLYTVRRPASFPYTLTGTWATDQTHLVLRNDQSVRQDLAAITGAGMSGYRRSAFSGSISNVASKLDSLALSPGDFAHLVVTKPNPADPTTWDWIPAYKAMHAAVTTGPVKAVAISGKNRLVGGLDPTLYEWVGVTFFFMGGAEIVVDTPTGDNSGLQIGSNCTFYGHVTGSVINGASNGNGFVRTAICIGRWWDGVEVSNVSIASLKLTGMADGTAMAIGGNTHGVVIWRLEMGAAQLGLMIHWSGVPNNVTPEITYHPHDIHIGSLIGSGFNEAMATASACYDIRIDYINGQNNYRDFMHIGGDFGEIYAFARDAGRVCKGISIGRITSKGAIYRSVDFNASAGFVANIMQGELSIDSMKATGTGSLLSVGLRIENRESGRIGFADVSGFANNIVQVNCNGGTDGELRSSGATGQGIIYSAAKHVRAEQVRTTNDNQSAAGGVGGLNVNATCADIEIGSLRVATNNAATHGCVLAAGSSNIRVNQVGGSVDASRALLVDNSAANTNRVGPCILDTGAASYSGPDPYASKTARGNVIGFGSATATSGPVKRGDIRINTLAAAGGPSGEQCVVGGIAGSTAVFRSMANLAV